MRGKSPLHIEGLSSAFDLGSRWPSTRLCGNEEMANISHSCKVLYDLHGTFPGV